MKRILIIGGLTAALAVGGAALAQENPRGDRTADTDNDSRVSQAEFTTAALARFDRIDANRDGTISDEERQAARQTRMEEGRDRRFERLDANSDGSISRAEFDAVSDQHGERGSGDGRGGRFGGHRGPRGGMGPGRGLEAATRGEVETRSAQMFARMDANGDGFLTADDREVRRGEGRRGDRGTPSSE